MNTTNISSFIISSFNSYIEELPEDFDSLDPKSFAKKVILQKSKLRYNDRIKLDFYSSTDITESILNKINAARLVITGEDFDKLMSSFECNFRYSAGGGDDWNIRLQYNGGILIRNHHRVIGVSESPVLEYSLDSNELERSLRILKEELGIIKLEDSLSDAKTDRSRLSIENKLDRIYDGFEIIEHKNGYIAKSRRIPDFFNLTGQSLVILPLSWLKIAKRKNVSFLNDSSLYSATEGSRAHRVILRIFQNRIFVYSTYRDDDSKDLLLDNFSMYMDDPIQSKDLIDMNGEIEKRINSQIEELDFDFNKFDKVIRLLIKEDLKRKLSDYSIYSLSDTPRFFHWKEDIPVTYEDQTLYNWNLSNVGVFTFNLDILNSISGNKLPEIISYFNMEDAKYYFDITSSPEYDSHLTGISNGKELQCLNKMIKRARGNIEEIKNSIDSALLPEDFEEEYKELLRNDSTKIYLIVETEKDVSPSEWHQHAKSLGSKLDIFFNLSIPAYGYNTDFYGDEPDEGNYLNLILSE